MENGRHVKAAIDHQRFGASAIGLHATVRSYGVAIVVGLVVLCGTLHKRETRTRPQLGMVVNARPVRICR